MPPNKRRNAASKRRRNSKPKLAALRKDTIPRAVLGRVLQQQIDAYGLSRNAAGALLREAPSQMSRIMMGHFVEFSADRLAKMLTGVGVDVSITLKRRSRRGKKGKVRLKVE